MSFLLHLESTLLDGLLKDKIRCSQRHLLDFKKNVCLNPQFVEKHFTTPQSKSLKIRDWMHPVVPRSTAPARCLACGTFYPFAFECQDSPCRKLIPNDAIEQAGHSREKKIISCPPKQWDETKMLEIKDCHEITKIEEIDHRAWSRYGHSIGLNLNKGMFEISGSRVAAGGNYQ